MIHVEDVKTELLLCLLQVRVHTILQPVQETSMLKDLRSMNSNIIDISIMFPIDSVV